MRRRNFIALVGGAAAWPLAARAQQPPERVRRIGVLMNLAADDPEAPRRLTAFVQGLHQLGWTEGRNVRIDTRWGTGDADLIRKYAAELVALAPVSWPLAPRSWGRCSRRPVPCRLCSWWSLTRSAPASSKASHDRVAT